MTSRYSSSGLLIEPKRTNKTFMVYDGTYPFRDVIGTVAVPTQETQEQEASLALLAAAHEYGGHPVVAPAF